MNRPVLTLIQSTHASLSAMRSVGLLERHRRLLEAYDRAFEVHIYSSDSEDFSRTLPATHHPMPRAPRAFYLGHLVFYSWLALRARKMDGVIKVLGSNIPTLPLVRSLSGRPMMVSYQWDYARQTRANERTSLKGRLAPLLERLALRPADLVLVTTPWLEERIRQVYGKPTVLLPNWVDLDRVDEILLSEPRDPGLVVYAGRLHQSKGCDTLLEAFAGVARSHRQARLLIFGVGEEREDLERRIRELFPGIPVELRGKVPHGEILAWMCRAAVFVLPTRTMEGHPKSLIEAMACGAACVATDVPGNREVLQPGESGILVPPDDPALLGRRIAELLDDPDLRSRLSCGARREAARFDFSAVVSREIEVLKLLERGEVRGSEPVRERDAGPRDVTAVIVCHRAREPLLRCVRSLLDQKYEGLREILLVDNNPPEERLRLADLPADFPRSGVRIVTPAENLGFGRGVNLALEETSSPLVLVLNPDLVLEAGALSALLSALDADPDAALAAPAITPEGERSPADPPRRWPGLADDLLAMIGITRRRSPRGIPVSLTRMRREFLPGTCLLARREILRNIGGFDPRFFLYYEDADLCRRLVGAGRTLLLEGSARARHEHGASFSDPAWRQQESMTAALLYHRKHGGAPAEMAYRAGLVLLYLPRLLLGAFSVLPGAPATTFSPTQRRRLIGGVVRLGFRGATQARPATAGAAAPEAKAVPPPGGRGR